MARPRDAEVICGYQREDFTPSILGGRTAGSENEGVLELILSGIPYWGKSGCGVDEIRTACKLAEEQWVGVMESLGMTDLELDHDDEDPFEFNTRVG